MIFRIEAVVTPIECGDVIEDTFFTNEAMKVYNFTAPGTAAHFDGGGSNFDTVFTIYTEAQYLAGDWDDYIVQNDDGSYHGYWWWWNWGTQSYLSLPYDRNYTGNYYLVVTSYYGSVDTDSYLEIEYKCYSGESSWFWWSYWDPEWTWSWSWCWYGYDTYCDSNPAPIGYLLKSLRVFDNVSYTY